MNAGVFIAWRGGGLERGEWSPVAKLDRVDGEYRFVYTRGACSLSGFNPFPGMPDLREVYRSETLFPMLANRLLSKSRPEYEAWLSWGGFDPREPPDPLAILSVTEGIRQTDALEVFPCPLPNADGDYQTRFFLHGLRHAKPEAHAHVASLHRDDPLRVEVEDDNPRDPRAVAVLTVDTQRLRLGYVPRYLARDVRALLARSEPAEIDLRVVRVNSQAPLQMRLLCRLSAPWPQDFKLCAGDEFVPIVNDAELAPAVHSA